MGRLMAKVQRPPGPPMTLSNMRKNGVRHLIGFCHNDACRHSALIDVSDCPNDVEVRWFQHRAKCAKCGRSGRWVDVRPNWKEKSGSPINWQGRPVT
jgi:hypothetical protein